MIVDDFRPIFITFIVVLVVLLFVTMFVKKKFPLGINISIIIVSLLCTILSAKFIFDIGMIADERGMGGDSLSFVMFIIIVGLSLLNFISVFYRRNSTSMKV